MESNIVVNGHPERLVKELRAAADAISQDCVAFIDVTVDNGNDISEVSLEFAPDTGEFGLEDKPYLELK